MAIKKKTTTKTAAITKKTVVKKAAVKKSAVKAPAVKKAAVKKPAVKKTVAKKPAAKLAVAKKSPVKKSAAAPVKAKPKKAKAPSGIPEQLRDAALKIIDERQGEDVVVMDLKGRSAIADYAIIATGRSGRQLAAIADYIRAAFHEFGVKKIAVEGLTQGDWVLIDAGDIIIHLFRPDVRRYYHIEDIWNSSPSEVEADKG